MHDDIKKYLHDILVAIESIQDYIGDKKDFFQYQENKMLRRAVAREIEIIGEAMNRIIKITPDIEITGAKQIIAMRNRVIHGYDLIDDGIIWGTISRHVPILKEEIKILLNV